MKELKDCSNKELMEMMDILSQNFEKVKSEMVMLNEILVEIETQHQNVGEELKSRVNG